MDFNITSTGILISCDRLIQPRYMPFDIPQKCGRCGDSGEIDFVVSKDGVFISYSRLRGTKFIHFDKVYDLPGHCIFRVKNRGRMVSIPHKQEQIGTEKQQADIRDFLQAVSTAATLVGSSGQSAAEQGTVDEAIINRDETTEEKFIQIN